MGPLHAKPGSGASLSSLPLQRPFLAQYVMGPLEQVRNWDVFRKQLRALKQMGVDGITTDVWWGLVERQSGVFDWSYYLQYAEIVREAGLRWVPILSFHRAGGNVGDTVDYPIPDWVWSIEDDMAFVGTDGKENREYISFWVRSAYPLYERFMRSFAENFRDYRSLVDKIYVGAGPAGELRYPSYQLWNGWQYPGIGRFQTQSTRAKKSYRSFLAKKYGSLEALNTTYGTRYRDFTELQPPRNEESFFRHYAQHRLEPHTRSQSKTQAQKQDPSAYGRDYLEWQQFVLEEHAFQLLSSARKIFLPFEKLNQQENFVLDNTQTHRLSLFYGASFAKHQIKTGLPDSLAMMDSQLYWNFRSLRYRQELDQASEDSEPLPQGFLLEGASLGLKMAGIHWQHTNPAFPRAAAQTAGYVRYPDILAVAKVLGASVTFTCMEMRDVQNTYPWYSAPRSLVQEVAELASFMRLPLYGENALALGESVEAYATVRETFSVAEVHGFTQLRLHDLVDDQGNVHRGASAYQQHVLQRLPTRFLLNSPWKPQTLEAHGLQLRIVGSGSALGDWQPQFGFPLTEYRLGVWSGEIPLNDPFRVEWMPVLFQTSTGKWEQVGPVFPQRRMTPFESTPISFHAFADSETKLEADSCPERLLQNGNPKTPGENP